MVIYKRLVKKIAEKSGKKEEEIIKMLEKKKEELGNLVSEYTALTLVAEELGVKLTPEKPEKSVEQEEKPPELIYNPFIDAPVETKKLMEFLNNIYKVAQEFIKQNFPNLDKMENRITTIAVMKLIIKTLREWK